MWKEQNIYEMSHLLFKLSVKPGPSLNVPAHLILCVAVLVCVRLSVCVSEKRYGTFQKIYNL